ncbi:Uncharacterised protein [Flavobacterium hibernum]|nr:Uncharacterised protein [Flavobacterium hibernum]
MNEHSFIYYFLRSFRKQVFYSIIKISNESVLDKSFYKILKYQYE